MISTLLLSSGWGGWEGILWRSVIEEVFLVEGLWEVLVSARAVQMYCQCMSSEDGIEVSHLGI